MNLSFLYRFHMQFFMHFLGCGYFTLPGDQIQNLLRKKRLKKYVFYESIRVSDLHLFCSIRIYVFLFSFSISWLTNKYPTACLDIWFHFLKFMDVYLSEELFFSFFFSSYNSKKFFKVLYTYNCFFTLIYFLIYYYSLKDAALNALFRPAHVN